MLVSPVIEVAQRNGTYEEFHPVEQLSIQAARRELNASLGVRPRTGILLPESRSAADLTVAGAPGSDRRQPRAGV